MSSGVSLELPKLKARSKRVSLSESLLQSVEKNIREASSRDDISRVIDQLVSAMEGALRRDTRDVITPSQDGVTKAKKVPPPVKPKPNCKNVRNLQQPEALPKQTPPALKPKPKLSQFTNSEAKTDSSQTCSALSTRTASAEKVTKPAVPMKPTNLESDSEIGRAHV